MKRTLVVVATKEELELDAAKNAIEEGAAAMITGVGGTNVIMALRDLPKDTPILNVGYCGSDKFKIGEELYVRSSALYHDCTFHEETFSVGVPYAEGVHCLTAGDFVQGKQLREGCVVDMELAYICALGFDTITAVKYVSDNLDYKEYVKASGNER